MLEDAAAPGGAGAGAPLAPLPAGRGARCILARRRYVWQALRGGGGRADARRRVQPVRPGLRHLHLGLDRPAQGRDERRTAASVNRLLWMQEAYGLGAGDDVVLQKTPFSFDVSVWEFFWPLMPGARLVVARARGRTATARYLAELIAPRGRDDAALRAVDAAGCSWRQAGHCRAAPGCGACDLQRRGAAGASCSSGSSSGCRRVELHNLYGPTEAAVDVTLLGLRGDDARPTVPIGRPIWQHADLRAGRRA